MVVSSQQHQRWSLFHSNAVNDGQSIEPTHAGRWIIHLHTGVKVHPAHQPAPVWNQMQNDTKLCWMCDTVETWLLTLHLHSVIMLIDEVLLTMALKFQCEGREKKSSPALNTIVFCPPRPHRYKVGTKQRKKRKISQEFFYMCVLIWRMNRDRKHVIIPELPKWKANLDKLFASTHGFDKVG